jgi:hypothetical protein
VDTVSILTPFFVAPNEKDLYDHYRAVAESTHFLLHGGLSCVLLCDWGAFRLGDKPLAHNLKQKQGSPTLYPVDQVELARFADRDRRTCADLLAQLVPNAQRSRDWSLKYKLVR